MSSAQYVDRRSKQRDQSGDGDVFIRVPTVPPPGAREIPLPDFYPTERTSTASFKAPVTAAGKKKTELAPPPPLPPGTLTTAIGYISTPVKYISSIFSSSAPPQPPEPIKPKEKLFKIDLEKEKEKQLSPKPAAPLKKLPNAIVEEVLPPAPTRNQQQQVKSQGSAWRRKNMMDFGVSAPLSPKPASKSRVQKRLTPASSPTLDLSPPKFNQMMISSLSGQSSYKVMSKLPSKEPEPKKKKDPRKITNTHSQKDNSAHSNMNKTNSKYVPPPPTKLSSPRDEHPIYPFPTVLPPRVPPPSYTIRSSNPPNSTAQDEEAKEAEMPGDNELENSSTAVMPVASDRPELVSCPSPTVLKPFTAAGGSDSSSINGEQEEFNLQETLGAADLNDIARVSRLDQLPDGRLRNATSLKNLFHDAKLVNGSENNASFGEVLPAGRVGALDVVLCSSTAKYPSLTKSSQSPNRTTIMKPTLKSRDASFSPTRKSAAPMLMRSQVRDTNPATVAPVIIKSHQSKNLKPSIKELQRKQSPLRVEDKHMAAVEESLGKSFQQRKSRQSAWSSSPGRDVVKVQRNDSRSPVNVKPNVVKKMVPKSKESSPAVSQQPSAITAAAASAAAAAVAAAAATAVASVIQPKQEIVKVQEPVQGDQIAKQDIKTPPRSPPSSWKFDKDKASVTVVSPRPRSPSKTREEQAVQPAAESATNPDVKPKRSLTGEAKDFLKSKFFSANHDKDPQVSVQDTSNVTALAENTTASEDNGDLNCLENYCGDPAKFFKAATMMGEIP
ncbi:hypothetical protein ElyMa_004223600 [Elysia marginata]|uniref:Uncharacterized protein n=1 Tax=Elysia marginata TaxID=1093978 RepID=A0AAV4GNZ0_9GAST|nr:hypothetical protein ElyMa_004223600 [Elysia marginata]